MATPIRWDNIRGHSLADASAPLQAAQRSFLAGIQGIGDTLASREAIDQANWQNTRSNNTNAFLNKVASYKNAEELKAAQESGALNALRDSYGNQVDQGAIRNAVAERLGQMQQQAKNEMEYKAAMRDARTAPLLDRAKAAIQKGDRMAYAAAEAEYIKAGGTNLAGLMEYDNTKRLAMKQEGRSDITFANQQTEFKDRLLTSAQQRQHMANQDARAAEQMQFTRENQRFAREDHLVAGVNGALASMQQFVKLSAGSPEGQAKIADYIDKIKDPDIQSNARKAAAELSINKDMTVAGVLNGISSIDKRDWFTNGDILYSNSNNVDDAVKRGNAFVNSTQALEFDKRQAESLRGAEAQYRDAQQRLDTFRKKLYPK